MVGEIITAGSSKEIAGLLKKIPEKDEEYDITKILFKISYEHVKNWRHTTDLDIGLLLILAF